MTAAELDDAKAAASWDCDDGVLPLRRSGIEVSGTPVGESLYVHDWLEAKVAKCRAKAAAICGCLQSNNRHALLTTLRLSTQFYLDHWLRTCFPSDVKWAAKEFDKIITDAYECATVAGITKDEAGMRRLRLPAKKFGLGFRSREWQADSAFVAAADAAISRFVSRDDFEGFLPGAETWLGSDWGKGGTRFKELFARADADRRLATCRGNRQLATSLRQSWALMQQEAGVTTGDMPTGGDAEKPCFLHHADHELIGGKGKGGQHLLTDERERAVFRATDTWFHEKLEHKDWRRVAWFACGKFATTWVTTMPDDTTALPNYALTYVAAAYIGLPQPMVAGLLGRTINTASGGTVGKYGHELVSRSHPGGGWDIHHDAMTNVMASTAGEAAVSVLKEVRGLLTAQYTPMALAEMAAAGADPTERRKQRIPDLMLDMHDGPTNLRSTKLADTKIIHANESNYKKDMVGAPTRGRAAEERQAKVAGEYVKAVQAMDRKYVGTQEGTVGPTEAALADHSHGGVVGLVFGAFGECSQSVDLLLESFGKSIGEQGFAEMGYRTVEVGVGVATWAIRREWSMTHWRESANLMWRNLEQFSLVLTVFIEETH